MTLRKKAGRQRESGPMGMHPGLGAYRRMARKGQGLGQPKETLRFSAPYAGPQVRAPLLRQRLGLRLPPPGNLGVVARLQDGGDFLPLPFGGAGVLRVLQQTVGKAFLFGRGRIAKDARDQPDGGIQKRLRGDLASGQDEIAKADLFDLVVIKDALVDTFEPATQQRDPLARGKAARGGLIERLATGRKIDNRPAGAVVGVPFPA